MQALAPPSFESQGKVQSKYINAGNLEYTLKNVRNKYDFQEVQEDPVFLVSYPPEKCSERHYLARIIGFSILTIAKKAIRDPSPPAYDRRPYSREAHRESSDYRTQYQRRSRSPDATRH